jgi:hypothetical protein
LEEVNAFFVVALFGFKINFTFPGIGRMYLLHREKKDLERSQEGAAIAWRGRVSE